MTIDLNPADPAHDKWLIGTNGLRAERVWHPDEPILESVKNQLVGTCRESNLERCGFVDSQWDIHEIPNVHESPERNFYMDNDEASMCLKRIYDLRDKSVIAIWHTHPNNVVWPSPRDIAGWPNVGLHWRYLVVTNDEVYEWQLTHVNRR